MSTNRIDLDSSEARNLSVDLSKSPSRIQRNAPAALRRSAIDVQGEMKKDARGHRYLRRLPDAVSYEMIDPWTAEIGIAPDGGRGLRGRKGQGSLAHIIVYGSVNNAPVYDHTAGLRRAMPRVMNRLAGAAEESVLGDES